ncbi:beta-galactosidase [Paenibacillus gansuensis]
MNAFGDEWIEAEYKAEVAVYYDVENAWAWNIQPHSDALTHKKEFLRFYSAAHSLNAATNIVSPGDSLEGYKVVIVPIYFLTNPEFNEELKKYAEAGGTVVFTYRTGVKEPSNVVVDTTLPGRFREMAGIEIHEYESLQSVQQNTVVGVSGAIEGVESAAKLWCDLITPTTAEVLAVYKDTFYDGTAAITRNRTGKGTVYYIGSAVEAGMLEKLYAEIFAEAGASTLPSPEGVEIVRRTGKDGKVFLAVMNHNADSGAVVQLPAGRWSCAVSGTTYERELQLDKLGSIVLVTS